jgi:hypothetical protein
VDASEPPIRQVNIRHSKELIIVNTLDRTDAITDPVAPPRRSRRNLNPRVAAVVAAAALAVSVGTTSAHAVDASSSTAGAPSVQPANVTADGFAWPFAIPPYQVGVLPSYFWGETEVCVRNLSNTTYAKVNITPRVGWRYINPGSTGCYRSWFWGAPIVVNNISSTGAWVRTWTT